MQSIPFINIHTHFATNESNVIEIVNIIFQDENWLQQTQVSHFNNVNNFYSVGIHPWHIPWHTHESPVEYGLQEISKNRIFIELENFAKQERILAIGETGLDKIFNKDLTSQTTVFMRHTELADRLQKPIIIHCVKSFDEIISIKKNKKSKTACIIHGFNKSQQTAQMLIQSGFYLSIGEAILANKKLQETLKIIPLKKLFLETDNSQFVKIEEIYNVVAEILNIDLSLLKENILNNFLNIINPESKILLGL